jgi:hypothetical protein
MGPCIIIQKHEVMAVDEWHDNGPQDYVTVSLRIQIAIDKMQLCSLSEAYACPYHSPTTTMGHSVHNVDIRKRLATRCHTRCLPSIREGHTPPAIPVVIHVEHFPSEFNYDTKLQSVQDPGED